MPVRLLVLIYFLNFQASDALFTWLGLQTKYNNELINNLGNFINRVLSFIAKPEG
jgi:methionyl-tRNA synthetase